MKVSIITLGCKVNTYESDAIKDLLIEQGDTIVDSGADACIINTCTVTNQASAKSRKMIRGAIKNNPNAIVAVIGCYSQAYQDEVKKIDGVDIILGNIGKKEAVDLIHQKKDKKDMLVKIGDILRHKEFDKLNPTSFTHTRAFLKIEDGCNAFCSYCIIPYSRGPVRSKPYLEVINDVNNIVKNGYKEIVLTGIHTGRYISDGIDFTKLVKMILDETEIARIRVSSIELNEITDDFIEMMKENSRIARHLHIPLQAGSDDVLKKMNRKYDRKTFIDRIKYIKSIIPDISITTDIIVGFPEETDQNFQDTLDLCKEVEFAKAHVFPFSLRDGTKACELKEIKDSIKDERVHELLKLDTILEKNYMMKNVGKEEVVILEENDNGYLVGHTSNYLPVLIKEDEAKQGEMIPVLIEKYLDGKLYGKRVSK